MNRTIPADPAALAAALDIGNDTTAGLLVEMATGPYADEHVAFHGTVITAHADGLHLTPALAGPLCEAQDHQPECWHASCNAIAAEAPWADECWKGCGWQHVIDAGSGSGFAGGHVYWTVLECGHTLMDESGDVADHHPAGRQERPVNAPDPIGDAAHALWDAVDRATGPDPEAPGVLEAVGEVINTDLGTWGFLAVYGTTPVRITVEHARPEEAAALGMDGNAHDPYAGEDQPSMAERYGITEAGLAEAEAAPDPGYRPPSGRPRMNWDTRPQLEELHQQLVVEDGEDPEIVARSLIGPKGRAVLVRVGYEVPGDQWPTAVYRGTARELAAIAAKASGSPIGRPPGGARQHDDPTPAEAAAEAADPGGPYQVTGITEPGRQYVTLVSGASWVFAGRVAASATRPGEDYATANISDDHGIIRATYNGGQLAPGGRGPARDDRGGAL